METKGPDSGGARGLTRALEESRTRGVAKQVVLPHQLFELPYCELIGGVGLKGHGVEVARFAVVDINGAIRQSVACSFQEEYPFGHID